MNFKILDIKTLKGINTKDILEVFNKSFSDYFIPFHLSEEQLRSKMLADKVDLSMSVGVFEKDQLVAFICHGFDIINGRKAIYNGGTGVIPEKRGINLTTQMYKFILPKLRAQGIHTLQLEVITENIQAIKSYEKSGYTTQRTLACYKGDAINLQSNDDISIHTLQHYDWGVMESFWDIEPTWQNSKNVVNILQDPNISFGAFIEDELVGYIIFNPSNNRIQQIAIHKENRRRKIASALILELTKEHGSTLSIINVDKSSKEAIAFFEEIGLKKNLEQLEMTLQLTR